MEEEEEEEEEEEDAVANIKRFTAVLKAARRRKNVGQVTLDEYESIFEILKLTHEQLIATKAEMMKLHAANSLPKNFAQRPEGASEDEQEELRAAEPTVRSEEHKSVNATWPGLSWRLLIRDWKTPKKSVHDMEGDGSSWFDELVVGDWFHIEWQHGRTWWMRVGDASIYVTVPNNKPPVLQILRGVYHARPSSEQDELSLAETDPDDDPYGDGFIGGI